MADQISYLKPALFSPYNILLLVGTAVFSAIAHSTTPLLVAAAAELVYLVTVPNLPPFRRLVRARFDRARRVTEVQGVTSLLESLSPNQRECYQTLCNLRDQIFRNYQRVPGGAALAQNSISRMNALLTAFVRLLSTLNNYRRYLSSTDRKVLEQELASLQAEITDSSNPNEKAREVKKRRVEILQKRLERFRLAAEGREVISHQLASIDDFVRLVHEQSITLRDPDSLGAQLDQLSAEIQATDDTVRDMERFNAFEEEMHAALPPRERVR